MDQAYGDSGMRILKAAKKLMAVQGYNGTSLREICEEASTNLGLISYHFGTKLDIFHALFQVFMPTDRLEHLKRNLPDDPAAAIRYFVADELKYRDKEPELIDIIKQELDMHTSRTPIVHAYTLPYWEVIHGIIEQGRRQSLFHVRQTDEVLLFVMGVIFSSGRQQYVQSLTGKYEQDVDVMAEQMSRFILRGLGVPL